MAESSPCLTDSSLFSPSTFNITPSASFSRPRPPRSRKSEYEFPHSQSLETLQCTPMSHHPLSLSKESTEWVCSDEDLEPQVRDCVSSLSGRNMFRGSNDTHTGTLESTSIHQEQVESATSIDSSTAIILSSRATVPGSAPLLQRYSTFGPIHPIADEPNGTEIFCYSRNKKTIAN